MTRLPTLLAAFLAIIVLTLGVVAEDKKPEGPFARGEKIPGDLTDILDGDKSGQISDAEVKAAIDQFKKEANARDKTERGQKILGALDSNKDGKVDDAEAAGGAVAARVEQGGGSTEAVTKIFRQLDGDSNGFITAGEYGKLKQIVGLFNPDAVKQLDELFAALDVDRDTAISFVESQLAADLFAESGIPQGVGGFDPPAAKVPVLDPKIKAFVEATFTQRDRDEDGNISLAESRRDPALRREFEAADASGDGQLTPAELADYLQRKFSGGR
jgi:Ca2+-binding EF-hand superfamily protein